MPSIKGQIFHWLLRNRHLLRLQLRKKTIDWNSYEAILHFREEVESGAGKFGKLPEELEVVPAEKEGVHAEWIIPNKAIKEKKILTFMEADMFPVHVGHTGPLPPNSFRIPR
jgi:hypothetical protein